MRIGNLNLPLTVGAFLSLVAIVAIGCGSTEVSGLKDGVVANVIEVTQAEDSALAANTSEDGHDEAVAAHDDADGHDDDMEVHDDALDAGDGNVFEITLNVVEGRHWGFDPEVIEVSVGQRVSLTLVNGGNAEHDVEVAGLLAEHIEIAGSMAHSDSAGGHDADVVAAHAMAGTISSVTFTPTKAGEYEFACTLPGHKEAGMVGKLIVTN